jgi:hypothetical protein
LFTYFFPGFIGVPANVPLTSQQQQQQPFMGFYQPSAFYNQQQQFITTTSLNQHQQMPNQPFSSNSAATFLPHLPQQTDPSSPSAVQASPPPPLYPSALPPTLSQITPEV